MIFKPVTAYPNGGADIDATVSNTFSTIIQGSSSIVSQYVATIYNAVTLASVYSYDSGVLANSLTAGDTASAIIPNTSGMVNGNNYYWIIRLYQTSPTIFITSTLVRTGATTTVVPVNYYTNIKIGMPIS